MRVAVPVRREKSVKNEDVNIFWLIAQTYQEPDCHDMPQGNKECTQRLVVVEYLVGDASISRDASRIDKYP
jgi:hypothetical protein